MSWCSHFNVRTCNTGVVGLNHDKNTIVGKPIENHLKNQLPHEKIGALLLASDKLGLSMRCTVHENEKAIFQSLYKSKLITRIMDAFYLDTDHSMNPCA